MTPPVKVVISVDPDTGKTDDFLWTEKEEPPPLVRKKKPVPDKKPGAPDEKEKPS